MVVSSKGSEETKNELLHSSHVKRDLKYDHFVQIGWGLDRFLGGSGTKEAIRRQKAARRESHQ